MDEHNQHIGRRAEDFASNYLQCQGLKLIKKNYRGRRGEIDLIMRDKNYYVFVEVRFRSLKHYGNSIESVNTNKQQRIIQTAQHYLLRHNLLNKVDCRFDIVALHPGDNGYEVDWLKNAFWCE